MPARSFRFDARSKSSMVDSQTTTTDVDAICPRLLEPLAKTAVIVTPTKQIPSAGRPSRTRKKTEHYNPLEENKKPQHKHSSPTRTKEKYNDRHQQAPKAVVESKEEPLILEPVSQELLCDHCNFGGDLMQCHAWIASGEQGSKKYSTTCEIGCAKLVHPFCVGREAILEGGWICTACSEQNGYKVKLPKELRNKDIVDYGYEFSTKEPTDWEYQQMEQELLEWGRKKMTTITVDEPKTLPKTFFGSIENDQDTEDGDGADSCAHSVGPCDVCKAEGDLIRCHSHLTGIGCGKGVHMYCVFRDEMPEGDWVCEDCAKENDLKLDCKYPAMGYEYPISDTIGSTPEGEDTFEWNEIVGYRIQVGSRIGVYDEEDDEYNYGTVERKDVSGGILHISFDGGESRPVYMRQRRIRLLSEYHPSPGELKRRMRSSLDPSLPNYIICGGGVTKAHDRKHAHRLLEHYVDVVLDDGIATSFGMGVDSGVIMYQKVLEKLKDDEIEFIQWDASIGGFGKASKKEIEKKIMSTLEEKHEERAQMPPGHAASPVMRDDDDGPILHALLVNGGHPLPKIPPKQALDDPFLTATRLQERGRRYHALAKGVISMQSTIDAATESASGLIKSGGQIDARHSAWDSDIFDDAPEENCEEQAASRISPTQSMLQQSQVQVKDVAAAPKNIRKPIRNTRKETISEVLAKSRGKIPPPQTAKPVRQTKKRGRPSSAKASLKAEKQPPPKKSKRSPKAAPNTNSPHRAVALCQRNVDKWAIQLKRAALFRKKHGHCNIPSQYPREPTLATWAKRQRHQYQLFLRKHERCTMTPERIQALGKIDFCFDTQQIKWLQKFEELQDYVKEHGHCRPSATKKGEQKLGAWVKHQRAQKKLFDEGLSTFITKNRVDMLNGIGFAWKIRK